MDRDFQELTAESADMSTVADSDGVYRYVSPAARRLIGLDPSELECRPEEEFVHPDDVPIFHATRKLLYEGEEASPVTYRILGANGSYRWVETMSRRVESDGAAFVVSTVRDVADRRRSDVLLQRRATTDPLTGVANRSVLMDRLGHAIRRQHRASGVLAVLFLDLDRFKIINDSLGHRTGDGVLQAMANRLHGLRPRVDRNGRRRCDRRRDHRSRPCHRPLRRGRGGRNPAPARCAEPAGLRSGAGLRVGPARGAGSG
jgi:PAS domain S-box-containing protein